MTTPHLQDFLDEYTEDNVTDCRLTPDALVHLLKGGTLAAEGIEITLGQLDFDYLRMLVNKAEMDPPLLNKRKDI